MKRLVVNVTITPDGRIVTYDVPGEVPDEIHASMATAFAELDKILGKPVEKINNRPGHIRQERIKGRQGIKHTHGPHGHTHE